MIQTSETRTKTILKNIAFPLAALFLGVIPLLIGEKSPYLIHVLILCMLYASLASTWNLIAGFAGIFIFGFQALFGLGAYVSSLSAMKLGVSPWLGMLLGSFAAMFVGAIVAIPSLKLRLMPYIAISTMCLGEVIRLCVTNLVNITRGELGLWGIPAFPDIGGIKFEGGNRVSYYYFMLLLFCVIIAVVVKIVKSPLGLALAAIKDSQDAAESLGVNVSSTKIEIFMISAFFAGMLGSFYAHYILIITPTSVLGTQLMTDVIAIGLVGGIATITGPIIGAFLLTSGMELLRFLGNYRLIIYGVLIVAIVLFMPSGLMGWLKKLRISVAGIVSERKKPKAPR